MSLRRRCLPDLPPHCETCGWRARIAVPYRDDYISLEVHHIIPRREGGSDERDNLVLLCRNCHDIAESLAKLGAMPTQRLDFIDDLREAMRRPKEWRALRARRYDDVKMYGFFWSKNRQFTPEGKRVNPSVARGPYIERYAPGVAL